MQRGSAVVNLPANVKAYAGRVVEAMAAGRPVISWEVPHRPRTRALFEDGEEILLYPRSEPAQLADHIRRILSEPEFSARVVENARRKVRQFHTVEHRVGQFLEWISTGTEPVYS
jgi:glycosyltransferase involved in cell wall biosynthesis